MEFCGLPTNSLKMAKLVSGKTSKIVSLASGKNIKSCETGEQ